MASDRGVAQVDYSKLAENMEWFMKDDATKPNVKKANNAWLVTRKKLFPDGFPASAALQGGAAKAKTPATPRKKKDADTPKTPRAKKTPAKKAAEKAPTDEEKDEDGEEEAEGGEEAEPAPATKTNGAPNGSAATAPTRNADSGSEEASEANVKDERFCCCQAK
jgi:hypothetical protein